MWSKDDVASILVLAAFVLVVTLVVVAGGVK